MKQYEIYRIILGDDLVHFSDEKSTDFRSAKELLELKPVPGIVIIDGLKGTKTAEELDVLWELVELRGSVEFCYAPIYISHTMHYVDLLVDGVTNHIEERFKEAFAILERGGRTSSDKLADNHNLRLLTYMYARGEEYLLSPICSPFSAWVYSYPEMSLILAGASKTSKICKPEDLMGLDSLRSFKLDTEIVMAIKTVVFLEENGYIARATLIDRIRKCPKCKTGHLNYVDLCPNCGSIDFQKKLMIHCFVCGHVAPDSDFKKNMAFVCPKCSSILRHLGSDYDHPLESNECNNCGSKFIEPDIKADCLYCRTRTNPSNLIAANIYSYKLTEKGSAAARTGSMQMELQLFDGQNNINFKFFCNIVEWMREYRKRYPDQVFTLLGIKFSDLYEVEKSLGDELYQKTMDELISRIRSMIRTTDITTSSAPDTFWILMPKTSLENSKVQVERIDLLNNMIDPNSENKIRIIPKCFEIPTTEDDISAEKYLELFSEELDLDMN